MQKSLTRRQHLNSYLWAIERLSVGHPARLLQLFVEVFVYTVPLHGGPGRHPGGAQLTLPGTPHLLSPFLTLLLLFFLLLDDKKNSWKTQQISAKKGGKSREQCPKAGRERLRAAELGKEQNTERGGSVVDPDQNCIRIQDLCESGIRIHTGKFRIN